MTRILVIEDEPQMLLGLRDNLELARERRRISVAEIVGIAEAAEEDPRRKVPPLVNKVISPAVAEAERSFETALGNVTIDKLCQQAEQAVADGKVVLIVSDRGVNETYAPVPALLALGAVHQHLIRLGQRTSVSLIVETGEAREVHHVACLMGMGAEAVNPYLALATVRALAIERDEVRGQGSDVGFGVCRWGSSAGERAAGDRAAFARRRGGGVRARYACERVALSGVRGGGLFA